MKYVLALLVFAAAPIVQADETPTHESTVSSDSVFDAGHEPYEQLFSVQVGPFSPESVSVRNADYTFKYDDDSRRSFFVGIVRSGRLTRLWSTAFYYDMGLGYSLLRMSLPSSFPEGLGNQLLNLNLLSFSLGVSEAWESLPWHEMIPFWEAGYRYTYFRQSGPSDFESADGGVGNAYAGAGFRYWINRGATISATHPAERVGVPVFVVAKLSHVFSRDQAVNLGGTTLLGGLSVGF